MKYLLLFFLIAGFLNGDEITRIESIVEDITKLRVKYRECEDVLNSKNESIDIETTKKLSNIENELKKYKKLLKLKENEIKLLKSKKIEIKAEKTVKLPVCKVVDTDKPNNFPKLVLKDKYNKQIVIKTKPSTYRLKNDAYIYDGIGGQKIEKWDGGTSFTSNSKTNSWVKITGFFINRVWVKSETDMWIPLKNVRKR